MKKWVFIFLWAIMVPTFAMTLVEGKDYQVVGEPPEKAQKVSVIEFFSYGCPWCYQLEKPLQAWVKKNKQRIQFERVPVVFHPEWEIYAKAYYTLQVLKKNEWDDKLFEAIQDKHLPLTEKAQMADFLVQLGLDKAVVESAFNHSTSMDLAMKEGMSTMGKYHVQAVPMLLIDEQYKVDLAMAGSVDRLFQIADELIKKSQAT